MRLEQRALHDGRGLQQGGKSLLRETLRKRSDLQGKQTDKLVGKLGNPIGIKSYKPFHVAVMISCRIIWA